MDRFHLKNKYFVLRHGRSIPNENGLIVASMEHGALQEYGLAPTGILQAEDAGKTFLKKLQEENVSINKVRIYSSPFSRTRQTAELVVRVLDPESRFLHIQILDDLRERYFGPKLELQSHDLYSKVWLSDLESPLAGPAGGESVADVARRLSQVILKLEALHEGCVILLVSHGDPLQILQAVVHAASKEYQEPSVSLEIFDKPLVSSIRIDSQNYAMTTGELRQLF